MELLKRKTESKDSKAELEPWNHVFESPDELRHGDRDHNIDSNISYPLMPSEHFRHSRRALREKLKKSRKDRAEVMDEFFASALADNLVVSSTARIVLDNIKIYQQGQEYVFDRVMTHVLKIKNDAERHVATMLEAQTRIENEMAKQEEKEGMSGSPGGEISMAIIRNPLHNEYRA